MGQGKGVSQVHPDAAAAPVPSAGVSAKLGEIAALVREGAAAAVCAISWDSDGDSGASFAPEGCADLREVAQSILAALARRVELSDAQATHRNANLPQAEMATLLPRRSASAAAACARSDGAAQVRMVVLARESRSAGELERIAELGCRAALAILVDDERAAARMYWRRQGAETSEKYASARAELARLNQSDQAIAELAASVGSLAMHEWLEQAAVMLARSGPFEQWIIALPCPYGLEVAASQPLTEPAHAGLHELLRDAATVVDGNTLREAQWLRGPRVCVPFEAGAVVLSSRAPVSDVERERLSAAVARLEPIVRAWRLGLELADQRALTHRLAYRMFNAVDQERARIARDLHDDHAQLIAATRIALNGGGAQARAMLERIEDEVHRKIRELKPLSLGRTSLAHALSMEIARLNDAGIEATLSGLSIAAKLSPAVRNQCWQFTREAIANVIRHSRATRVELSLAMSGGLAVITVADNGKGIEETAVEKGGGLGGMRERLSLLGGRLKIDSRPGATVLTAEIPDPS
jgi:signal transduction histidine kinase